MLHNNLVKILALLSFYHSKNGPARSCKFIACIVSKTQFQNVYSGCNVHKWIIMSPSSFLQYKVYRGTYFNKPYHNLMQYNTNYSTEWNVRHWNVWSVLYRRSLYIYVCVYVYIYIYIYMRARTHTRARGHTHTHIFYLDWEPFSDIWGVSLYTQLSALTKDKSLRLLQIVKFANKIMDALKYCTQGNLTQCKKWCLKIKYIITQYAHNTGYKKFCIHRT